jgi:subtilisin family serine protease
VLELWVDRDQLRALAAHDDVAWIDPWRAPANDMDLVRKDAGTNHVEFVHGYCGEGVSGEVLDSGIEATHMDLDGILEHGPNNVSSHGTSTYGIVFGNGSRDGDGDLQGTGHMACAEAQGIFADYGFLDDRFQHTLDLKESPYFASFQSNSWGSGLTTSYGSFSVRPRSVRGLSALRRRRVCSDRDLRELSRRLHLEPCRDLRQRHLRAARRRGLHQLRRLQRRAVGQSRQPVLLR